MRFFFLFLILAGSSPAFAAASGLEPQISKFEFQAVHFGDFPSVDMICVRGLCPVGEVGVGISNNSYVPPAYNQKVAITHYHGAKISTPEFSYFDDKMFMVRFVIECNRQGVDECVDAVKKGLDGEYGLIPLVDSRSDNMTSSSEFVTESGSLITIFRVKEGRGRLFPTVRIVDKTLMDRLRKSFNPDYVPRKIEILDSLESPPATE